MGSGNTACRTINRKRLGSFARHVFMLSVVGYPLACTSDGNGDSGAVGGASGFTNQPGAGGGSQSGSGGGSAVGVGGASGGAVGAGGAAPGVGGASVGSGGVGPGFGGSVGFGGGIPGTGGASGGAVGTGGTVPGVGGASGGTPATGGSELGGTSGGTSGSDGGVPGLGGSSGGTAGTPAGGSDLSAGGAGAGGAVGEPCADECLDQCLEWGGTERDGSCEGARVCCEGATVPAVNPLAHLVSSAEEVGLLLAERFNRQALAFNSVANLPGDGYKTACEWYGALAVANLTGRQDLLNSLVTKFDPLKANFVNAMTGGEAHVDRYIFGMVPLEIYLQTGDESYLSLGTEVADRQQVTNQTRDAIDDMFMMTGLQLEAYRATGDDKYIEFMAQTMVDYLGAQQSNGLFYHNVTQAPVHWGRGNGWFAAGMAEIMRDLEPGSYPAIEEGYERMMEGLLAYQGVNGLWYQVLDMPEHASNWEESSGSAMFTYAMVAGVRRGVLDAETYVPVIEAAWAGLQSKISGQGDVRDICVGTWYKNNAQEYMALTRLTGDGHGQAPVLWIAAELLR